MIRFCIALVLVAVVGACETSDPQPRMQTYLALPTCILFCRSSVTNIEGQTGSIDVTETESLSVP